MLQCSTYGYRNDRGALMHRTWSARSLATIIALIAWVGLLWTFYDYSMSSGGLLSGLWQVTLYYTHWATFFAAIIFTGIAFNVKGLGRSRLIGNLLIILAILTVMYWGARGVSDFMASPVRSKLIHGLLPPLVILFWVLYVEPLELTWKDPLIWTIFPLVYTLYGLLRGALTGEYPYDLGDVHKHGYRA